MIIDENLEFEDLNKKAEEVQDPAKAAKLIKQYEDFIKTKRKGIINVAYHQGQVLYNLKKNKSLLSSSANQEFTKPPSFVELNFVFKLCKKYPKLLTSSKGLGVFKDYDKDIKAICEENEKDFQC